MSGLFTTRKPSFFSRETGCLLAFLFIVTTAPCQAPKTESQVPAYPGAKLVSERQEPTREELASGNAPDFAFALERTWSSAASADQVIQFYGARFGASPGSEGGGDPNDLGPGESSAVGLAVEYYDPGFIEDCSAGVRAALAGRSKLSKTEGWARSAQFSWAFKEADGDPFAFTLTVTDASISDEDPSRYNQKTDITLDVRMFNEQKLAAFQARIIGGAGNADAWEAARKEQQAQAEAAQQVADRFEADMNRVRAFFAEKPTEKALGVPLYPGARYDPDLSAFQSGYSIDRALIYVFEADCSAEALTKYYEQKTGNRRVDTGNPEIRWVPISFFPPEQPGDKPSLKDFIMIGGSAGAAPAVFSVCKAGKQSTSGAGR